MTSVYNGHLSMRPLKKFLPKLCYSSIYSFAGSWIQTCSQPHCNTSIMIPVVAV